MTLSPGLREQYITLSEAAGAIQKVIDAQLENTPNRLLNTVTGHLCDRVAQINTFESSTEYKELLSSTMKHAGSRIFGIEHIGKAVKMYFRHVMLSHRWEGKEPLLHVIEDKDVYELEPNSGIVKLQSFCKVARDAGYHWAWSDTCCIDKSDNVELQESVNSMFVWYRQSALTIVYLSDVPGPPLSESGALAKSAWNTRGWTLGELLAAEVVLFYQQDWTLYLDDRSVNHKESDEIMQELANATGINAQALVAFRPEMRGAREKLQWASTRVTTWQEDIAYSLFGILGVHLPALYGEKKENALGRLLQEVVARSGDITALYWVGKSSDFNSCLPADINSYETLSCTLPSLSQDEMRRLIYSPQDPGAVKLASTLYALLDNINPPRFADSRLHLPCIAFRVTEIRLQHMKTYFTYEVKADGLHDLLITTKYKLIQLSPADHNLQTLLLVRPWNRRLLQLLGHAKETEHMELVARLGKPFLAFLLARKNNGEFERLASDSDITAEVKDITSVHNMMDVRTVQILPDITSYEAPPCTLPSWSEDDIQTAVTSLQKTVTVESVSMLYTLLGNLSAPRFANRRLQLPCIVFPVAEVSRRRDQGQQPHSTFTVKADGLEDLLITTEDGLTQFSREKPTVQALLLVRPWDLRLLELPDEDDTGSDSSLSESPLDDSVGESEFHLRGLRLMVRLGQPFSAFLLAQQQGGEYKRIASDRNIIAQVKDPTSIQDMMDIRTLEII